MTRSRTGAARMCVACRESVPTDELVRLAVHPVDGRLVIDAKGRLPGRGAWVHPTNACVERLMKHPGMLRRSFETVPDVSGLKHAIVESTLRLLGDGLSQAAASGALVGGFDLLAAALREHQIRAVLVASDAAERTQRELRAIAPDVSFVPVPWNREELGYRIGKGSRAALGVKSSRSSAHLLRQLHRLPLLG